MSTDDERIEERLKKLSNDAVPKEYLVGFADEVMSRINKEDSNPKKRFRFDFSIPKIILPMGVGVLACLMIVVGLLVQPGTPITHVPNPLSSKAASTPKLSLQQTLVLLDEFDDQTIASVIEDESDWAMMSKKINDHIRIA